MGYIYKIQNKINNKKYIGQTTRDIETRYKEHLRKKNKLSYLPLYRALLKYGEDNFSISIVEECEEELLDDREIYWINYFDTYNFGYNCTKGGQGRLISYNEEDLQNIIERYNSGERLDKILKEYHYDYSSIKPALIKCGINIDPHAGPHSISKSIIAVDNLGNIIMTYDSISDAAKAVCKDGCNWRTNCNHISEALNTNKVRYGYIWKTKDL